MEREIIKSNGKRVKTQPKNGTDYSLEELKAIVHGYIEIIMLSEEWIMVINEEGKLMQLPYNEGATAIAHKHHAIFAWDCICGDVLVCKSEEVK